MFDWKLEENNKVSIYDYDRNCYISWELKSLYDYWTSTYMELKMMEWGKFTGFDYESSFHFSWEITNKNISIYDYELSQYFNYSC